MEAVDLTTHIGTPITIDACWPCHVIWFDHLESTSLSPGSVIELFKRIHAVRDVSRNLVRAYAMPDLQHGVAEHQRYRQGWALCLFALRKRSRPPDCVHPVPAGEEFYSQPAAARDQVAVGEGQTDSLLELRRVDQS
ncbi:MAG: hypothetical protein IPP88_03775 [Betaproteobacteria bacterium]|nr:hypothetical protein [Betaproteobacteria bacterium]